MKNQHKYYLFLNQNILQNNIFFGAKKRSKININKNNSTKIGPFFWGTV